MAIELRLKTFVDPGAIQVADIPKQFCEYCGRYHNIGASYACGPEEYHHLRPEDWPVRGKYVDIGSNGEQQVICRVCGKEWSSTEPCPCGLIRVKNAAITVKRRGNRAMAVCRYCGKKHRPGVSYSCGPYGHLRPEDRPHTHDHSTDDRPEYARIVGEDDIYQDEHSTKSPVRPYRTIINDSGDPGYVNRLLCATPTTGLVRIEWVQARYGQVIPVNWSMVTLQQFINSYIPLRYQVADAQNLIVREAISKDFEWLLLIEHDVCLPPDGFIKINAHIRAADTPVVSGLHFSRSRPSEPLVFRGRGTSFYDDWEMGDKVWCDGVPTGCLLIHTAILRAMWDESPEYLVGTQLTRRVFETPRNLWFDPATEQFNTTCGTSDLDWCTRVMEGGYFKKAGWDSYQDKEFPFLVDTDIFCRHIDVDGTQYP